MGAAGKGPAVVPVTVGVVDDFTAKFGPTDGEKFGPLAAHEWLRRATALTYLRVLGVGDGLRRDTDGSFPGRVNEAGFVVGEQQPQGTTGQLTANQFATSGSGASSWAASCPSPPGPQSSAQQGCRAWAASPPS